MSETTYEHGSKGNLTIGGTVYSISKFEYEQVYDEHDVTMTSTLGKKQPQLGLSTVKFNGEAFINIATSYMTLQNGSVVAITYFAGATYGQSSSSSGQAVTFTSQYCTLANVKYSAPVNNIITVTFSGTGGPDYVVS